MSYWELSKPTFIENWQRSLYGLSIAQLDVPLTVEDARRLGSNIIEFGETFLLTEDEQKLRREWIISEQKRIGTLMRSSPTEKVVPEAKNPEPEFARLKPANISDIRQRVSDAVDQFPGGVFVRLGSRSPKDSYLGYKEGFCVKHGTDPLRFMLDSSERMYEDLTLAIQNNYTPHIFVRQWQNIKPWQEFRCFMRRRLLVGISQYNYLDKESFPEITRDPGYVEWVIRQWFPQFQNASHLDDVVFDVTIKRWTTRDNTTISEVKLLEINPLGPMTDPCLFGWNEEFDGSFRFNKEEDKEVTNG